MRYGYFESRQVRELEMPWGWLGFRQRKRLLVTSCIYMYNMQRPCVTSVTVSPYNLPSNQIKSVVRVFVSISIFHDASRKENTYGKRSRNTRDNKDLIYL